MASSKSNSDTSLDLLDESFKSAISSQGESNEEDQRTQSPALNLGASRDGFIPDAEISTSHNSTTDEEEHSNNAEDDELFENSQSTSHSIIEEDDDDDTNIEDDASEGHSIMVPETPPRLDDHSEAVSFNDRRVTQNYFLTINICFFLSGPLGFKIFDRWRDYAYTILYQHRKRACNTIHWRKEKCGLAFVS